MARGPGVRVVAGSMRGRRLVVPAGDGVRPTKDFVREAVFSALDARGAIVDASVADLYAGSGALAIEAMSRGASRALLVERDRTAIDAIVQNLRTLELLGPARLVRGDVAGFVAVPPPREAPFDLVFADPPYDTSDAAIGELLGALTAPGWLADDALVVVERPVGSAIDPPHGLRTCWERTFGDTLMTFYDTFE